MISFPLVQRYKSLCKMDILKDHLVDPEDGDKKFGKDEVRVELGVVEPSAFPMEYATDLESSCQGDSM